MDCSVIHTNFATMALPTSLSLANSLFRRHLQFQPSSGATRHGIGFSKSQQMFQVFSRSNFILKARSNETIHPGLLSEDHNFACSLVRGRNVLACNRNFLGWFAQRMSVLDHNLEFWMRMSEAMANKSASKVIKNENILGKLVWLFLCSSFFFALIGLTSRRPALAENISTPSSSVIEETKTEIMGDVEQIEVMVETVEPTVTVETQEVAPAEEPLQNAVSVEEEEPVVEELASVDDKSEYIADDALENCWNDIKGLQTLLHDYMEKGKMKAAIAVLDRLIVLLPDQLELKYLKAQAYDYIGDMNNARKCFLDLLESQPLSARALQGLAIVMEKEGDESSEIVQMVEKALKKATSENKIKEARNLRMLLGQIHTLQGNMLAALKQYQDLSKDDPNNFRPYLCQGLVYSILGRTDEAEKNFKKYTKLCPKNFPNRSYLDELMEKAKFEARRLREASEASKVSAKQNSNSKS